MVTAWRYSYLHQLSVWPQECKIRSALQNETTVTEDPMTSLCMVRKSTINRILLLVNLIWSYVLFYSRSVWQIFSPNKAKTIRAFFYILRTFSYVSCYSPGSRSSRHRSLQVAGLQAVSQGGPGQPHPIESDLDLRLPIQLWHNHTPHKCWNANQKNQGAPLYFLTSTLNRNDLTYFCKRYSSLDIPM